MCKRFAALAIVVMVVTTGLVVASEGGGTGGLPYESALKTLTDSLTGPFAYHVGLGGIVGAVCLWWIGQELNGMVKGLLGLACVVSIMLGASKVLTAFVPGAATIEIALETFGPLVG